MTRAEFLSILETAPLIASVQASPDSPLNDPDTLLKLAQASLAHGVKILRLEGVDNIRRIKETTRAPVIGLIKRSCPENGLYITPTLHEVEELLATDCEVIALDSRFLNSQSLEKREARIDEYRRIVSACRDAGRIILADCCTLEDARLAVAYGADIVSTTFTTGSCGTETFRQPRFSELGQFVRETGVPILAEGLFHTEAQVRWACLQGAKGVVVGGALNDPVKVTARFVQATQQHQGNVGAVDIGGTWIRFGVFSHQWKLLEKRQIPLPALHKERLQWIRKLSDEFGLQQIGVSTGGEVDPRTGNVVSSKVIVPDNEAAEFAIEGIKFRVMNDGLATTWGHAAHFFQTSVWNNETAPRTVTLALGTGLGCGITSGFSLLSPGQYPRLNDLEFENGSTFEEVLGGLNLGMNPTPTSIERAQRAFHKAVRIVLGLLHPDAIFVCGGVTESVWFRDCLHQPDNEANVVVSPFGPDAGLYGAAALALFPPIGVFVE